MPTPGAERDRQASMAHDRAKAEREGGNRGPSGTARGGYSRPGGQVASSRALNGPSLGGRIAEAFGGASGYATNPYRPGMGSVSVPNIPHASIGQILGGGILGALHPTGVGTMLGISANVANGLGNEYGPYGMLGKGIDSLFGGTPGKIEGTWGAGRVNDQGDPGKARNDMLGLAGQGGATGGTGGTTGGTPGSLANPYGTAAWNGGYVNIPGPSQYGYQASPYSWNYLGMAQPSTV